MIYRYDRHGRRWAVILPVVAVWACVVFGLVVLDMVRWIGAIVLAFTLPALWDIFRDSHAWVEVTPGRIAWQSAVQTGERTDVDHVRLNRRFDGGIRITLVHVGGATTRLPPDIAPAVEDFQDALKEAGIATQRHPFSIL